MLEELAKAIAREGVAEAALIAVCIVAGTVIIVLWKALQKEGAHRLKDAKHFADRLEAVVEEFSKKVDDLQEKRIDTAQRFTEKVIVKAGETTQAIHRMTDTVETYMRAQGNRP